MSTTLIVEIFLLLLLIVSLYLEFKYPCNHLVKALLTVVVIIKIALIAHIMKKEGEKEGEKTALATCLKSQGSITEHFKNDMTLSSIHLEDMASEIFVYTFPVVENNKYLTGIPVNQFKHWNTLDSQAIITPNIDTLYSKAVIDLRNGSVTLSLPKIDRYYVLQFVDLFTRNFFYISPRTNPHQKTVYTIYWDNPATPRAKGYDILSPSAVFVIIGRMYVQSEQDLPTAIRLQNQIQVHVAHSEYQSREALPPYYNAKKTIDPVKYLDNFLTLYKLVNPEHIPLPVTIATILKIRSDPRVLTGLRMGQQEIKDAISKPLNGSATKNNWFSNAHLNTMDSDYLTRAVVAWQYIYMNDPDEAMYMATYKDREGNDLDGRNTYNLILDNLPQSKGFWSLTSYKLNGYLTSGSVKNIGSKNNLPNEKNMIHLSSSGRGRNWLQIPKEKFYLILRIYLPEGDYTPRAVIKTS